MKHVIKPIVLISALFLFSCSEAQEETSNNLQTEVKSQQQATPVVKNIDIKEFKQLAEKTSGSIVDVRTPGEFNSGNIAGAKNINIAGNFSEEIQKLDKDKPVFVYCAVGGRSSKAAQMMNEMGFKEVYNVMGGYNAYVNQ